MTAEEDALRAESEAIEAQRDTLAADAAATPSDPGSLRDSGRLESMNAELATLRRKVAAPGHWPNLAHLPVADPIPPGTDPTGFREEVEVFGQEPHAAIRYHEGEQNSADQWRTFMELNNYAEGRNVALKYERMIYGSIEGVDDGKPGKHEGGLWRFQRFLGVGGYGTVGLWRKRDETTGDILDSVAVKDEGALSTPDWINPLNWRDGLPIEIWMHEHFKKIKPACPYLVPSRGYRLNLEQRRTRLYLVFMPGHNLSDLMRMNNRNPEWEDDYEIPHEFMFYAFLAMAEACLALDRGWWGEHRPAHEESSKNDGRREGWVPIVHRDIKPGNVFLGLADWDEMKKWDMVRMIVLCVKTKEERVAD
ncbi:hypothetical protein GTA08_BOTSDO03456 [Neofusicoccum parvum]|nr:hypothetical protein GTA08_BOTSDO03456 [Neofusicoccum parvum]